MSFDSLKCSLYLLLYKNSVIVFLLVDAAAYVRCSTLVATALSVPVADGDLNVFFVLLAFTDSAILTPVGLRLFTFCFTLIFGITLAEYIVHKEIVQENRFSTLTHFV